MKEQLHVIDVSMKSLLQLLKESGCRTHGEFDETLFLGKPNVYGEIHIHLVHFNEPLTHHNAIKKLAAMNLSPATAFHALTFSAQHPQKQLSCPITALISPKTNNILTLHNTNGIRTVKVMPITEELMSCTRFLAISSRQ